jgi:hypothetical protein
VPPTAASRARSERRETVPMVGVSVMVKEPRVRGAHVVPAHPMRMWVPDENDAEGAPRMI